MKSLTAAAESVAKAHYLQFRIQWASIALLYYDFALTFPAEVRYMWGKKFRFSTVLYICCRYALIANVLFLAAIAGRIPNIRKVSYSVDRSRMPRSQLLISSHCDTWYKFDGVISVLGRAAVIATLTGRTYAVYGCNRIVLALLGSLGLTCIILDILHVPGLNCIGGTTDRMYVDGLFDMLNNSVDDTCLPALREAGLLAILMCVFDFLAALLTIVRCVQECRVGGSWKMDRGSFLAMISQQGTTYYCLMSIFTIAAVVLNFRAPSGTFFQRIPNAFNLPVSCLLTARFLLQLREWQSRDSVSADTSTNGAGTRQVQTLSALQAVAVVDAALLDDFGDYDASAESSWDTDSTPVYGSSDERNENNDIALDNIGLEAHDSNEKESA